MHIRALKGQKLYGNYSRLNITRIELSRLIKVECTYYLYTKTT